MTSSQVPTCSLSANSILSAGVLSATTPLRSCWGRGHLYAVLVSALVLMAMVRRGQDGTGRLEVPEIWQHRPRSVGP